MLKGRSFYLLQSVVGVMKLVLSVSVSVHMGVRIPIKLGQCKARPFNFVLVCWFFIFCSDRTMATVGPPLVHGNGALAPHE